MKIYLVDGTYELFRSHFGAPPRKAPDGREVGATLGLLRSLLMLLTKPGITHMACAFDHVIESFRNGQYPGYKTGAGVDPNLIAQFELSEEAVSAAAAGGLADGGIRGRRCPVQRDRPFQARS
jgi:5'-3' exonuclease